MNDLVSIITPCYNSENFICDTIESVISQTYTNWEMLICDDCSKDNSADIIKSYCIKDNRIKYLKTDTPSGSPTEPRNICIRESQGRFIAFLDSDDIWKESHLENLLGLFRDSTENVVAVCSWYSRIDEAGVINGLVKTPHKFSYRHLFYDNFIGNLTGMYDVSKRGKVYQRACGHEDYIMWLDVLKYGGIAKSSDSVEAYYRVTDNSVSSNKIKAMSWRWHILRDEVGLSVLKSAYYFFTSVFFIWLKKSRFSSMLSVLIKAK